MRQRKTAKRRQAKQAQAEARKAAREQAKQLAAAAETARRERAERAASALAAKGVDTSGDTLWTQKQKELKEQAVARAAAERKQATQSLLKGAAAREALAQWLLSVHSVNAQQLADAVGIEEQVCKFALRPLRLLATSLISCRTSCKQPPVQKRGQRELLWPCPPRSALLL